MNGAIKNSLYDALDTLSRFISDPEAVHAIDRASQIVAASLAAGGKVMTCGNGGSLCDATHFAEELTGRFRNNRRPLPAVAMNDPAHITCVANDYSYGEIYSRYVEAVGSEGDVLVAFSTSGNSPNIVAAAEAARQKGMKVIGMTRSGDNPLSRLSDVVIGVPHDGYSDRIQEVHILAVHIIIENTECLLGVQ